MTLVQERLFGRKLAAGGTLTEAERLECEDLEYELAFRRQQGHLRGIADEDIEFCRGGKPGNRIGYYKRNKYGHRVPESLPDLTSGIYAGVAGLNRIISAMYPVFNPPSRRGSDPNCQPNPRCHQKPFSWDDRSTWPPTMFCPEPGEVMEIILTEKYLAHHIIYGEWPPADHAMYRPLLVWIDVDFYPGLPELIGLKPDEKLPAPKNLPGKRFVILGQVITFTVSPALLIRNSLAYNLLSVIASH